MNISDLVTDYLEYLEIEQNRSQATIANYDRYLQRLVEFIDDATIDKLTNDVVRKWRIGLARQTDSRGELLSKATINYHLIALRSFLKYLAKRDIVALDSAKIELATTKRPQVSFLEADELARLFAAVDTGNAVGQRDRAILELLFSSGLRVSELVNLNIEHINLDRREFVVRGKGQKDRPVFISEQAADWLDRYLQTRSDDFKPLFIHYAGSKDPSEMGSFTRLTARSIQRMVHHYALRAGLTKTVTPHTLRHSFATDLLINGADIRSVQGLLGHANIATTQIYTHITDPQLRSVHDRFHSKDV